MEAFTLWLMIVVIATGALFTFLFLVKLLSDIRRLEQMGAPRPLLVIWRSSGAHLFPARPGDVDLVGRRVWLVWDIRWLSHGATVGHVAHGDGAALDLELERPVALGPAETDPGKALYQARFEPNGGGPPLYGKRSVRGRLFPEIEPGVTTTAEIVVYPEKERER